MPKKAFPLDYADHLPVPLKLLRTQPLFREPDPVIPVDLANENLCGGKDRLVYNEDGGALAKMIVWSDIACEQHDGNPPPSQVGLFLAQFPDRAYDDCTIALAHLHLHREIGPGCCAAAIRIEPLKYTVANGYPEGAAAQIQRWAAYHLTRHPWEDSPPARQYIQSCLRSRRIKWVSAEAHELLLDAVRTHHHDPEGFLAQPEAHAAVTAAHLELGHRR